jgi:hypothetical protein
LVLPIIILLFINTFAFGQNAEKEGLHIPIGNVDTLQWLQTHIQNQSAHFSGKPLSVLWDSLYGLRWKIAEYNPLLDIKAAAPNIPFIPNEYHKDTLYVHNLTFYLAPISDGGVVDQIQTQLRRNNDNNHNNFTVNTHVKYFKINFQNTVKYLRSIASSKNGSSDWSWGGFQEYFWGGNIVQSVTVGEY